HPAAIVARQVLGADGAGCGHADLLKIRIGKDRERLAGLEAEELQQPNKPAAPSSNVIRPQGTERPRPLLDGRAAAQGGYPALGQNPDHRLELEFLYLSVLFYWDFRIHSKLAYGASCGLFAVRVFQVVDTTLHVQ